MTTFERYFIEAPETHFEKMNPYYHYIEQREPCIKIIQEFGMDPSNSHIINGHVPVKLKQGESPLKGGGLLFMIDGGISKSYQKQTGIGGYTFIANSRYLALAEHQPIKPGSVYEDSPKVMVVEAIKQRVTVADTDTGRELSTQIQELSALLQSYRNGAIKEQ